MPKDITSPGMLFLINICRETLHPIFIRLSSSMQKTSEDYGIFEVVKSYKEVTEKSSLCYFFQWQRGDSPLANLNTDHHETVISCQRFRTFIFFSFLFLPSPLFFVILQSRFLSFTRKAKIPSENEG